MRRGLILIVLLSFFILPAQDRSEQDAITFQAFDVWIDSEKFPLVAYQVEIQYQKDKMEITGLEGGAVKCFAKLPYFDKKGWKAGKIIIAAFTTKHRLAPKGKTRVARVHTVIKGNAHYRPQIKFMAAARPGGKRITAKTSLTAAKE